MYITSKDKIQKEKKTERNDNKYWFRLFVCFVIEVEVDISEENDEYEYSSQAINNVFYLIQTIVQNLYRTTYGFIIISHVTAISRIERTHTLKQTRGRGRGERAERDDRRNGGRRQG